MSSLRVHWVGLAAAQHSIGRWTKLGKEASKEAAETALKHLKEETPEDTGKLVGNWKISSPGGRDTYTVSNATEYALDVHEGTAPGFANYHKVAAWANRKGLEPKPIYNHLRQNGSRPNRYADRAFARTDKSMHSIKKKAIRKMRRKTKGGLK